MLAAPLQQSSDPVQVRTQRRFDTWQMLKQNERERHSLSTSNNIVAEPAYLHALNCTQLVSEPVDVHPVRSPQAVHSVITRHLSGRSLVEIGTRNGDGMACFTRIARKSVAIEMDPEYCRKLEQRAALVADGRAAFSVRCDRYQVVKEDADVFTWWQQSPHLKNVEVLQHLRGQQDAGWIRRDALAIVLIENGFPDDMRSYHAVRNFSIWSETVAFDETALCRKRLRKPWLRARAHGSFYVLGIRIRDVPAVIPRRVAS
jgi:hypothetical protein